MKYLRREVLLITSISLIHTLARGEIECSLHYCTFTFAPDAIFLALRTLKACSQFYNVDTAELGRRCLKLVIQSVHNTQPPHATLIPTTELVCLHGEPATKDDKYFVIGAPSEANNIKLAYGHSWT